MKIKRRHDTQAIKDAVNLTTLLQWGSVHRGSFTLGRHEQSGMWYCRVYRSGWGNTVFDGNDSDISRVVSRAALAITALPEWHGNRLKGRKIDAEMTEYDLKGKEA
jgi:hypothetical protein